MRISEKTIFTNNKLQPKNTLTAYLLLIFFGTLGVHRLYTNNYASAATLFVLSLISLALPFMWVVVSAWLVYDLFSTNDNVEAYNKSLHHAFKC
jgi:TM2 domain-containing membrane protein YozV